MFQNLVNKKEGNITRVSNNYSPQAGSNLAASRQAGAHLSSGKGSNTPLASPLLFPGEGDGPRASQAGLGLGAHLPSGQGSNSSPQATAHLPSGERSNSPPATAHLPPREAGSSSQAPAHFPSGERSSSSQATAHLPPREGSGSSQATAHFPPREAGSSSQATAHLPPREGNSTGNCSSSFRGRKKFFPGKYSSCPRGGRGNSQAGQVGNEVRSGRQGFRHSTRYMASQASQENSAASQADSTNSQEGTLLLPSPIGFPKGLLIKNLTLSGSLTYPANLWPQLKGLFLLKDPTLWLPPSNPLI